MSDCENCGGSGFVDHMGFSLYPCEKCRLGNAKEQQDWADRLDVCDVCDVCEVCGNLVGGGRLNNRISHAITLLYTHGLLNSTQRDKARANLKKRAGTIVSF